jgi:DNA-binding NarL/FixJ family response regulator
MPAHDEALTAILSNDSTDVTVLFLVLLASEPPGPGRDHATVQAKTPSREPPSEDAPPPEALRMLTERERTIAALVSRGMSNRQIGHQLFLSPHTVNYHLRQIFRKLSIGSRVQLTRMTTSADLNPPQT